MMIVHQLALPVQFWQSGWCRLCRRNTFAAAESSPLLSDSFASPLVLLALAACSFASLEAFACRQQSAFGRR